jgi:hypothetical protein
MQKENIILAAANISGGAAKHVNYLLLPDFDSQS